MEGSGAAVTQLQFSIFPADGTVLLMLRLLLLLFLVFFLLGNQEGRRLTKCGAGGKGDKRVEGMKDRCMTSYTMSYYLPSSRRHQSLAC